MSSEPFPPPPARWDVPARARIRWGLPDALLIWFAAGVLGGVAQIPVAGQTFSDVDPLYKFGVLLPAQQVPVLLGLVMVSRLKGLGSLRRDFGLRLDRSDIRSFWKGPALQIMFWLLLIPLTLIGPDPKQQQLIEDVERAGTLLPILLFSVGAVVMAPIVEETLYRGLLLRSLLRRVGPAAAVFISAGIFASVHLLGDPNTLRSMPALAGLGVVLGAIAIETGSLSRPILIHAGFNLTTVLLVVLAP